MKRGWTWQKDHHMLAVYRYLYVIAITFFEASRLLLLFQIVHVGKWFRNAA